MDHLCWQPSPIKLQPAISKSCLYLSIPYQGREHFSTITLHPHYFHHSSMWWHYQNTNIIIDKIRAHFWTSPHNFVELITTTSNCKNLWDNIIKKFGWVDENKNRRHLQKSFECFTTVISCVFTKHSMSSTRPPWAPPSTLCSCQAPAGWRCTCCRLSSVLENYQVIRNLRGFLLTLQMSF